MVSCSKLLKERDINEILANELRADGFLVLQGLRLPPREIDIVALDPLSLCLTCLEIKRSDWKETVNQAIRSSLYGHYSIAVLPKSLSKYLKLHEFTRRGIGLLYFDYSKEKLDFKLELKPTLSRNTNRHLKRRVYKKFNIFFEDGEHD
jgi:hypothetical protein